MPSIRLLAFLLALTLGAPGSSTQFPGLSWRLIGPFRAGRVTSVAGVPGDPSTYYFGTPGGGIWKTNDAGQTWLPIFDSQRIASIGALAVAPSDPRIIYAGTGEQTRGRGVFRSNDAGATWQSAGLEDVLYIQSIFVDPRDPGTVIVAANSVGMGLIWRPMPSWAFTASRGIFKTTDGGKHWAHVFSDDKALGIVDMCAAPDDPHVLYASVYYPATGEGESRVAATSNILRSTDEGSHWTPLESKGLPETARKRLGITVAPGMGGRRLYAILDQGFFRSDDGGATWSQSTHDPRVLGSEYFGRVFADPKQPDVVYVAQTSLYRSSDGGRTFAAFAGAPSGDDFHVLWIDPANSSRMILGVDQGAIISVNGGQTWSSWYNQPTGQFYHVSTDNAFPYRVYAAQQDSGTAAVLSRSEYGRIMAQDWYSIGGFEYSFITPDPANPNLVYSGGWYGSVVRFDRGTGQTATVFERGRKYRTAQMAPLVFSPQNSSTLYLGTQFVLSTSDGGMTWKEISPDLTGYVEAGDESGPPRPTITSLAPSPLRAGEIWAGTSNRRVYLTLDPAAGWKDVSPPGLTAPALVLYVEASHHDPATAYLTVGAARWTTSAYVARTRDYGKTWEKIVNGIPENEMVRVVREDPKRKGLLYAGTDTGVFISWDDGGHWQSISFNLPATPVTDLCVHGNDLAISTYGRGLWIMDNISPLRDFQPEISAADAHLFAPATAMRVRWDNYQDTPYPAETPAGQNPPDGTAIDYFLKEPAAGELTLAIYDDKGAEVAKFSSAAAPDHLPPANAPEYWFAPAPVLTNMAGVNRFIWDMRYPPPARLPFGYYGNLLKYTEYTVADHAVPGLTPRRQPLGPLVAPGKYTAELRYAGKTLRQPFTVELDPRVRASQSDLIEQRDLALEVSRGMKSSHDAFHQVDALRAALEERREALDSAGKAIKDAATQLEKKIDDLMRGPRSKPGFGPVNRELGRVIFSLESADMRPAPAVRETVQHQCDALANDLVNWKNLNERELLSLNQSLAQTKIAALPSVTVTLGGCKP